MRRALKIASALALAGIVAPPILYFNGSLAHDTVSSVMLLATVVWFVATPFWMNHGTQG
jgi:hypothetical protein